MKPSIRRLPDAELEVMQALWGCEVPAARAAIEQHLPASHPMAQTTLLTLLTRLSDKGFVAIQKDGRKSLYTPLICRPAKTILPAKAAALWKTFAAAAFPPLPALCAAAG